MYTKQQNSVLMCIKKQYPHRYEAAMRIAAGNRKISRYILKTISIHEGINTMLKDTLVRQTKFLNIFPSVTLQQRLNYISYSLLSNVLCNTCKTPVLLDVVSKINVYLHNTQYCCSWICGRNGPNVTDKMRSSYFKTTGYTNPSMNPEVKKSRVVNYLLRTNGKYSSPSQTPEFRESYRQTSLKRWGTSHPIQSSRGWNSRMGIGKRKSFTAKDGTVFNNLRGYEPQALEWMLTHKNIEAKDILCDMHGEEVIREKQFPYSIDKHNHVYNADFWIPSQNRIIEVKSIYTLLNGIGTEKSKGHTWKKNKLKRQSVLDSNKKFSLIVMHNGRRVHIPDDIWEMSYSKATRTVKTIVKSMLS